MKHLSYYFSSILFLSLSVWLESRNQAKLEKILNRRWHDILKGIVFLPSRCLHRCSTITPS